MRDGVEFPCCRNDVKLVVNTVISANTSQRRCVCSRLMIIYGCRYRASGNNTGLMMPFSGLQSALAV